MHIIWSIWVIADESSVLTGGSSSVESSFWLVGSGSVISFSKSFVTLSDDRGSDRFLERFSFRFDGGWIPFPDDLKNMISFLKNYFFFILLRFLDGFIIMIIWWFIIKGRLLGRKYPEFLKNFSGFSLAEVWV